MISMNIYSSSYQNTASLQYKQTSLIRLQVQLGGAAEFTDCISADG